MLVDAHHGSSDTEMQGVLVSLPVEAFPALAPDTACFPAAKTVGDRGPVPKLGWQVAPGGPCTGEREDGFEKHPIAQRRWTPSGGCESGEEALITASATFGNSE